MTVPRRAVQVVELDEGVTVVSLICEDLARLDEVADLLRAIGPTLVVTTLPVSYTHLTLPTTERV